MAIVWVRSHKEKQHRIDATRLQYLYPTQYDVGVDNNNFTPVSFEQVKRIISKQNEKVGQQNEDTIYERPTFGVQ